MKELRMRGIARLILVAWAGWWTFYAAGDIGASGDTTETKLTALTITGIIFGGTALLAWHCEHVGGVMLILEGLLACAAGPLGFFREPGADALTILGTLALPPILVGVMLLECWWISRPAGISSGGHRHVH